MKRDGTNDDTVWLPRDRLHELQRVAREIIAERAYRTRKGLSDGTHLAAPIDPHELLALVDELLELREDY